MSIITLLTDFGLEDEYVGVMKGVILSINPAAVIVDITHRIEPQGVLQAAYLIQSAYRFFPKKTIHVIVVDPEVGSGRAILAYEKKEQIFIAPDNGVLTLLLEETGRANLIRVENSDFFLKPVSRTFHGRDIFAPVAAHLSGGADIQKLGPALDPRKALRLAVPKVFANQAGVIDGRVISIDRFGNLTTNIHFNMLAQYGIPEKNAATVIAETVLKGVMPSYISVQPGEPLVVVGSRGYLEIAVNKGSAKDLFNTEVGASVRIGRDH